MGGALFTAPLTEQQLLHLWDPIIEGRSESSRLYRFADRSLAGGPLGVVELAAIDRKNGTARVARFLIGDPRARGNGIGTEVLRRLVAICFGELDLHRVSLAVFDFDEQAIRCYEKVGFRREGLICEARRVAGRYWSYYEMGILRQEWEGKG